MSESKPFDALVSQILGGQAPKQVRAAAGRGALPLPRTTLVHLYVVLRADVDEEVRREAEASLRALNPTSVLEILKDEECTPEVLDHFASRGTKDEAVAERIAFHRSVPVNALATLAGSGTAAVIELVLTNQERLLAQPVLLDRLSVNPALRADQRGRILELLDRATRARPQGEGSDAATEESGPRSSEISAELQEAARLLQVDIGELFAASEILDGEEFENAEDPVLRSAYRKILLLNTAQKAILAMRGGREERMILIRDSNKLVALGVLRNPRILEDDVETISRMRNVSTEVLRQVGQNREWAKNYAIVNALLNNPKTPPGVSTNFISRLQVHDLKRLVANHDVPELIRRMARRTIDTRTEKRVGLGKKK